ncbi:hypothetical protein MYU51_010013 [Penicillium brevicompactum]
MSPTDQLPPSLEGSPLKALPNEILAQIAGYLHTRDPSSQGLLNLRLTCQKLNEIASQRLFRRRSFNLHRMPDCLINLQPVQRKLGLLTNYARHVRVVHIENRNHCRHDDEDEGCPLAAVRYLEGISGLIQLKIAGKGNGYQIINQEFHALLQQASVLAPPQDRIFQNLRSGKSQSPRGLGILFFIPQLRELFLRHAIITSELGVRDPAAHVGSTGLRTLHLGDCQLDFRVLADILSLPSTLKHLVLIHNQHRPDPALAPDVFPLEEYLEGEISTEDVFGGIWRQRQSLETLVAHDLRDGLRSDRLYELISQHEAEFPAFVTWRI